MTRALLAVPLAAALLAWGSGVLGRAFDYDEVMQAHAIWQIAHGLVPFRDFFECHPPFLWYPFVPALAILPDGPELFFGLRILSALGFAAWLVAMLTAARAARPALRARWWVAAGAITACTPPVLDLAVQFRPDVWAWAAAFAALARATRARPGFRRTLELGIAGSLCALALPKLAPLFPAFCAIDLARRQVSRSEPKANEGHQVGNTWPHELAGYAAGIGTGIALALGFLFAVGVDPREAWDLSVRYHGYVAAHTGFAHNLWVEVIATPAPLAVALAGLIAWAAWLLTQRMAPTTLELAVLATAAIQLALVPFPYAQYAAPMFVLAAIFVPYLGAWAERIAGHWRPAPLAALACAAATALALVASPLAAGWRSGDAARFADVQRVILELAPPEARIVVPPPFHPVARRDSFYALIQTWLPSGVTTEETLRELALPHADRLGEPAYRRELETSRPAVVLFTGRREFFYSPEQAAAIDGYLQEHADDYRRVVGLEPPLWVRADLLAAAAVRSE
jgi:hypothetical protein